MQVSNQSDDLSDFSGGDDDGDGDDDDLVSYAINKMSDRVDEVAAAAYSLHLSVAAAPHWDDASMKTARFVSNMTGSPALPPEVTISFSPELHLELDSKSNGSFRDGQE